MENNENEKLTQEDLFEILRFADSIYNSNLYGYFTPTMSNQNLIDLNNNPKAPTIQSIREALANYKSSEDELQGYSEFMDAFSMLYERFVEYYTNMLAFDLDISCKNAYAPNTDYKSEEYKKDLQRVYKFLDNFNYKDEFRKVVKELVRKGVFYTWLRDSQGTISDDITEIDSETKLSKYTLQTMPQDFCKLTGKWERGFLYDFDMNYFTKGGVSLNSYDPIFKTYYRNVFGDISKDYKPTTPLANRYGTFAMYTQTSPDDGAFCFLMDSTNISIVPFLSPMIGKLLSTEEMEKLQRDKNIISAKALLVGEIQTMDKQKSGNGTDAMTYNLKTLLKLMALVKKGLNENINAVAMPTASPKLFQYTDSNKDMATINIKNTVGQGISASRLMYSDDKTSESEIQNQIVTDYNVMKNLYEQFNNFLEFFINKKTRKYKFNFKLSGCTYPFIREYDKKNLLDLADKGIILAPRTYAKVVNMTPQDFDYLLQEGKYSDWTNTLLSQLVSIHTQSQKGSDGENGGRPSMDSTEISDSGSTSRDYG